MAFKRIDQTSPAADLAARRIRGAGFGIFIHDKCYALVPDATAEHGWRLHAEAESLPLLAAKLRASIQDAGAWFAS